MTIRFAAPPSALVPRMSAASARNACGIPANDNRSDYPGDDLVHAALRHFAEHGMAAAQRARKRAEMAFFAGDRQGYLQWLEICRALDRRMASELAAGTGRIG